MAQTVWHCRHCELLLRKPVIPPVTTMLSPYQLSTFSAQVVTTSGAENLAFWGISDYRAVYCNPFRVLKLISYDGG